MRILHRFIGSAALLSLVALPLFVLVNVSQAQTTDPCPAPAPAPSPSDPPPAVPVGTHVIHINELLVNPVGTDTDGEFIELWNPEISAADLSGWSLVNAAARSTTLVGVTIPGNGSLALPYAQTHLTLTNTGGTITLRDPSGTVQSTVTYGGDGKEGQAYARTSTGSYAWTSTPTPAAANVFEAAPSDPVPTPEPTPVDTTVPPTVETPPTAPDTTIVPPETETTPEVGGTDPASCDCVTAAFAPSDDSVLINELRDLPDGTMVSLHGVVSLTTGRIGTTIFAIQEQDGSSGTYVRMYGAERPELLVGDAVTVVGKVARAGGSMRVTTGKGGVVPSGAAPGITMMPTALPDLVDALDGVAVAVEGELMESGKGWMLLSDASGKAELRVAFEQPRTFSDIPEHSAVAVTGVLHFVSGKPELLADDATMRATPPAPPSATDATGATQTVAVAPPTSSPVVGGALALSPIVASLGVLGWKKWRGIPVGLS